MTKGASARADTAVSRVTRRRNRRARGRIVRLFALEAVANHLAQGTRRCPLQKAFRSRRPPGRADKATPDEIVIASDSEANPDQAADAQPKSGLLRFVRNDGQFPDRP